MSSGHPSSTSTRATQDPVVLEDLAAVLRLPGLFRKLDRVLSRMLQSFGEPADFGFGRVTERPTDGVLEYGHRWRDPEDLLAVFAGLTWGDSGHDPLWEVRIEALPRVDPTVVRERDLHRIAARRAESRFREWDRFWYEDTVCPEFLFGASAAGTRFLEETDPDGTAAEYLGGALYALHASGAARGLLEAVSRLPRRPA